MAGRRLLLAAGCAISLAGCSGTPFGDQLARSFSGPTAAPQAPGVGQAPTTNQASTTQGNTTQGKAGETKPGQAKVGETKSGLVKPQTNTSSQASHPLVEPKPVRLPHPPAPADYRVTIKLPSVDPSAPAEALTKALRSAGLSFEVETIERVRPGANGQGATVTPAPPPR